MEHLLPYSLLAIVLIGLAVAVVRVRRQLTSKNAELTAFEGEEERMFAFLHDLGSAIGRDPTRARHSAVLPVVCATTPAELERRAAVIGSEFIRAHAAIGSPALIADRVEELRKAGADTIYFHIYDIDDLDHIALLGAEVLRQIGDHR